MFGEHGDDVLLGGTGNDLMDGGAEHDTLDGGAGADTMRGGEGSDLFFAGAGNDLMTGGAGDDTFRFEGRTFADFITDFSVTNDKIQIAVSGVDDFDDLRFSQTAEGDAIVSWGSPTTGSSVTLLDVSVASLSSDDFSFG
jgi:Ca2+-binding RTX toxin-like protein